MQDFAKQEESQVGIQTVLIRNKQENKQYLLWSAYSLWIGIVMFIPLFIYAVLLAIKDKQGKQREPVDSELNETQLSTLPAEGEWLEAKRSIKVIRWVILISSVYFAILFLASFFVLQDKFSQEVLLMIISVPLFSLILIPVMKLSKLRIGFFKDHVTIKTDKGISISTPYNKIKWHPRAFIIGEWAVPIGNPAQSMFPYQQLHDNLMPHVLESNRLSIRELFIYQWHSPDATLKSSVLTIFLATALIVFLKKEMILVFISDIGMIS